MTEHYYLRLRGKVQGPIGESTLKEMIRQGRISRLHQISTDRLTWHSLAHNEQFFAPPKAAAVVGSDLGPEIPDEADFDPGYALDSTQSTGENPTAPAFAPPATYSPGRVGWEVDFGERISSILSDEQVLNLYQDGRIGPQTKVCRNSQLGRQWMSLAESGLLIGQTFDEDAYPAPHSSRQPVTRFAQHDRGREQNRPLMPHRGATILVLGILSWVLLPLLGFFAWSMGSRDLAMMKTGHMDPSGETITRVGYILGMIPAVIILAFVGLIFFVCDYRSVHLVTGVKLQLEATS